MKASIPPIPGERAAPRPDDACACRLMQLRPYVRQTGDDYRKPWLLRSRRLLDYLVVYIADGTGLFTVGDSTFRVSRGSLVWIPPDTPHEMSGNPPVMHCVFAHFDLLYDPARSHWDACIPGGVLDLSSWRHLMHPPIDDPEISSWSGLLPVAHSTMVGDLLTRLAVEHRRAPTESALALAGMVMEMLGLIKDGLAPLRRAEPHWLAIQSAAAFIQEHTGRDLDVARLADAVGLSPSHFRRLFHKVTGQSPRAAHRQARIRRACEMLVYETTLNVSQIAYALGFSTVHNFSRAFRDVVGIPPTSYRDAGRV